MILVITEFDDGFHSKDDRIDHGITWRDCSMKAVGPECCNSAWAQHTSAAYCLALVL